MTRRFNEENERIKRQFLDYLKHAEGKDEATLDKVAAALVDFETALGFADFKTFNRDWAGRYKKYLERRRNARTGKPLGLSTRDSLLRMVKGFFHWLASQQGYKSRVTYADVQYFNNNAKEARVARGARPERYPSLEQCAHAFGLMPDEAVVDRRNRAIFASIMLTGGRDGALSSLRLKHVDLVDGKINFDGREVRTKNGKSFETWFFPVDPMYRETFEAWVTELRETRLYGPGDALFPKQDIAVVDGRFTALGLSRDPYANAQTIQRVIKWAFRNAGLPEFSPQTFRKTLAMLANTTCKTLEQHKAWSQNLGHDHLATTVSAYMPVPPGRQSELIRGMQTQP
jgi:integrase